MALVAKLVSIVLITRVVVEEDATDEQIVDASRARFLEKVHDTSLGENIEEIKDDTECPYDEDDITYEIIGYMTASDYEGRNGTDCGDGYPTMDAAWDAAKELQDEYVVVKVQSSDREEIKLLGEVPEEIIYVLGENTINGVSLNEKIRDEELHEYHIIEREDFIDTLIGWIAEAEGANKEMMRDDLDMILTWDDEYIFSSNSTNSYIQQGDSNFNETCKELLELSESL